MTILQSRITPILLILAFVAGLGFAGYWLQEGQAAPEEAPTLADVTQARVNLLEHESITHPGTLVGTAVSVAGDVGALVTVYHADVEASTGLVRYFIQGSPDASGNVWTNLDLIETDSATGQSEALSNDEAAGSTFLEIASSTGFTEGDWFYVQDGAVHEGEWHIIQNVDAAPAIEIWDGLTYHKDAGNLLWSNDSADDAVEVHPIYIDTTALSRIRIVVQNEESTGPNIEFFAPLTRFTDFE